jgi:hypothetical protein
MTTPAEDFKQEKPAPSRVDEVEHLGLRGVLSLILSSARVEHSGSSLRAHLLGTYEILKAWGAEPEVCLAGALHSIYSTQFFARALIARGRRKEVAAVAGETVERLVHLFGAIDRESIRSAANRRVRAAGKGRLREYRRARWVCASWPTIRALRLIDIANEVEQLQREYGPPFGWLTDACAGFRSIDFVPSHLTADALLIKRGAERRLVRHYDEALAADGGVALRLFLRCAEEIPRCAEPRLLLSVHQLAAGDTESAYLNAQLGLNDLRGWGAAWDPRVPLRVWDMLGNQLIEAARNGLGERPNIALEILHHLARASSASRC